MMSSSLAGWGGIERLVLQPLPLPPSHLFSSSLLPPLQSVLGGSKGGLFGTLNSDFSPMVRQGRGEGGRGG